MDVLKFSSLALSGLKAILIPSSPPVLATIILTDQCNLSCRHCAVANQANTFATYSETLDLMKKLKEEGTKILFFCGGEVFLWQDGGRTIHDLVRLAKKMGFVLVCVVTNGTIAVDIPEADSVFLSIDGSARTHDLIRGETFFTIMENLQGVSTDNVVFYMAVNKLNYHEISEVTQLASKLKPVKAISFNFHTPYSGTEELSLNKEQKEQSMTTIKKLIKSGYPVFNLPVGLDRYLQGNWGRPCRQCVVYEAGQEFVCGRCSEIPDLCEECGYLFAVEFSLLLKAKPRAVWQMLRVYLKYS
ncbi:radical SAM protein [Desulfosporosinus sp. PR]|uniref:radical SAM protein n=1 Tax=Candidatus Desulfosporosinus nitrosoreducens TaxID=3401928 RepID=UPI0027ECD8AC|nr:radical SAM protein [Desulfosporosinus sp. PR]MDQ7093260.1 radical SAM protein [Desulfosporosinus sp. PR]